MTSALTRLSILPLAVLIALGSPAPATSDEEVLDLLRGRAEQACDAALGLWLHSNTDVEDPAVAGAVARCYAGLSQLHVMGEVQEPIAAGVSLGELPAWWLSSKTRLSLDPYLPLASRTFTIPTGAGQ